MQAWRQEEETELVGAISDDTRRMILGGYSEEEE